MNNELMYAIKDLNTAIKLDVIPEEYMNTKDLTNILNVILVGENLTNDDDIYQVGMFIVKHISKTYRGDVPVDDGSTKRDNVNVDIQTPPAN